MIKTDLNNLPRETLVKLLGMAGKNWLSVDGLWFQGVEDEFGIEAAHRLDLRMWKRQSTLEGRRLKETLGLNGGLADVITAFDLQNYLHAYPDFDLEEETPSRVIFRYTACPVQETRVRQGRGEFHCKEMTLVSYVNTAAAIDPRVKVRCIFAPPDQHPRDIWCRWELTL